jgi:uncharacterized protein YecE (DUF72 family)
LDWHIGLSISGVEGKILSREIIAEEDARVLRRTIQFNGEQLHVPPHTERSTLTNWAAQTPKEFRFSLKAPQEITHFRKLRDCESMVRHFADVSQALGQKLGATLFQLPPSSRCDLTLLREFLEVLPPGLKAAFEFRHESWFNDDVFAALRAKNFALCIADSEKLHTPIVFTAKHVYFRLRDEGYGAPDIQRWAREVQKASASADDTYVYFKHEEQGLGADFARRLMEDLDRAGA